MENANAAGAGSRRLPGAWPTPVLHFVLHVPQVRAWHTNKQVVLHAAHAPQHAQDLDAALVTGAGLSFILFDLADCSL